MASSDHTERTLPEVILYTRAGCHLCEEAREEIRRVRAGIPFAFRSVDIDRDPALVALYNDEVPVIFVNGKKAFRYQVEAAELRRLLKNREQGTGNRE